MTARPLGGFMVNAEIFPLRSQYARTPATLTKRSALLRLGSRVAVSNGKSASFYEYIRFTCRGRDDLHRSPPAQIRTSASTHTALMKDG